MSSDTVLRSILENARRELLDTTTRNRLLSTPRSQTRSSHLEIVDELSEQVFQRLAVEKKVMSFLPVASEEEGKGDAQEEKGLLFQPGEDEADGSGALERHTDDKLQTRLTSERLQKRLLKLFYDARTYQEEQGVNILYLALGFLKWYEDDRSDRERYGPLLLVPVTLERQSATSRFKIRYTDDDIATNLSLQARLKVDFGIRLPDLPELDELSPGDYYQAVARVVQSQRRWEVLPNDMVLWFFSFSKFLMYRDLEPENWPKDRGLDGHPILCGLLRDRFREEPPLCGDDEKIDPLIHPIDMVHILDADSSQAVAIEEVKRGRNLVIQGPPGTGKSQTIANLIAAGVKAGKRVLFVAEKMAALEVVRRRLDNAGVGDMCLELHSSKANKKAVLQDLDRTLRLGQPQLQDVRRHCEELNLHRDQLNLYLQVVHTPNQPSDVTVYQAIGELVRLRAQGTKLPSFRLKNPLQWSRAEFQERRNLLRDHLDHVSRIGVPQDCVWRGVELEVVLPTDVDRVMPRISSILGRLNCLTTAGRELADRLGISAPSSARDTAQLARLAQRFATAPSMDRQSMANAVWAEKRQHIDTLLAMGRQYADIRASLSGVIVEAGWDIDATAARRDLAAYGRSWFRIFWRAYRQARAVLRGILTHEPPNPLEQRLAVLDSLIQGQKARAFLRSAPANELGKAAFGTQWNGVESDWASLAAITKWESECRETKAAPDFRSIYALLPQIQGLSDLVRRIGEHLKPVLKELAELLAAIRLNFQAAFDCDDLLSVPLAVLTERLHRWQAEPESLSRWVAYQLRRRTLESKGLAELATDVHSGQTTPSEGIARFEMAYYEELIRDLFRRYPRLGTFDGNSHAHILQRFKSLDEARIGLARQEVASAHFEKLPARGADVGEVGLVYREIEKKRRQLPIRRLLSEAGRAVQAIKPVFMMSPISVAQYLEPGAIDFDLLLIDEASQVQPVDALGAVARAKQIVVVGDSKQLPPTRFFTRMLGEDGAEEPEADELHAGDIESILGLCCAQGVPQRMLRWHYRSRHHSLIAVSNHEFYDDRLYVIPSPAKPAEGHGLVFHPVPQGVFDRGGSATNRIEAKAVAETVMAHARHWPNRSLGVGAFSVAQRDAILDELELFRRADPSLEHFFVTAKADPFFVKNLENIQGDERDVIFISVGYGKDNSGYMAMNFGPLAMEGGERRLNVLITRARECCEVFSSIHADDIDPARAKSRGAQALKDFLKYAETGLLDTGIASGKDHDSEFERQVARALAAHGFETHPQVGVAGFFIDLAVVDPGMPGRYLLGIECDGANYHRARWARDRDRLRAAVLEDGGWVLHRIWSTDWFNRPQEELRKTLAAIEAAKITWAGRATGSDDACDEEPPRQTEIARVDSNSNCKNSESEVCCEVQPYVVASFRVETDLEIHEVPASELARVVGRIVAIEGPVHREEIARRVTQLWGLQRTGSRIRDAVERALQAVTREPGTLREGDFFSRREQTQVQVRDRGEVEPATLRRPEMLPPAEIRKGVTAIVQVHLGVTKEEAVTEAARLFGFKSTNSQLREVIEREIDHLLSQRAFDERNGKLCTGESARE